jgi:hypothetical protein
MGGSSVITSRKATFARRAVLRLLDGTALAALR